MEKIINVNQKLGEIVSIFPGASEIFNEYKIDYCCGGHDTLAAALEEKGLSSDEIVERLNREYNEFINQNEDYIDWRVEKPSKLIRHILKTHHDYTKKELRELDALVFKILKVHFEHHSEELLKVHRLFGSLKTELEEHLIKEEEHLFPLIEAYELNGDEKLLVEIHDTIEGTENEHEAAGNILKQLEKITRDFSAPEGACTTYRLVYARLHELEKDLFKHIYLENSVLFNMI